MVDIQKLPKVELHVHLDGSVRPSTVAELTNKNLEEVTHDMVAQPECQNLNDYLTKFTLPIEVMQTRDNLKRIAYELALDLVDDGIVYAEVRFAPLKHIEQGLTKEEVVEAVLEGFRMVPDIKIGLILCMMRDMTDMGNMEVVELAKNYLNKGVVAIDLAGAEALFKTSKFNKLFEKVRLYDIPFTIHAGEADGASSIKAAISFGAKRIGHGVRILQSQDLIEEVKENHIVLEVCPTSNVQTRVAKSHEEHQLRALYDFSCLVTINTDNRTVSNTTLTKEIEVMMNAQGFTIHDIVKMNEVAMQHSFASEDSKKNILRIIKTYKDKL